MIAPDEAEVSRSSDAPSHELVEVATEAQLEERNGRLLVQMGGRYVVRRQHSHEPNTCLPEA